MGYPTIYLFPAADKQNPIEYDGERTAEAIIDFINNFRSIGGTLLGGGSVTTENQPTEIINSTPTEQTEIIDSNTLGDKEEL